MRIPVHLSSGQGTSYWEANGIAYLPTPEYSAIHREYRGDSTTLSTTAGAPPRLPPSNSQSDMVPFPPQPQPHHTNMFSQQGGQDPYRHPPPGDYMNFAQPAPRQRTAIACNYCRRRKIRCSGFESSHDGRCSNCQRFNQECVFTPVSSQAQAFVPVQAAYPNFRNGGPLAGRGRALYPQNGHPPDLYGAHGQRLDPAQGPYAQDREFRLPSPTGAQLPSPTGPYNRSYDESQYEQTFRKRPHTEPHVALLPPPIPGSSSQTGPLPPMQGRRGSADPYAEQPAFAPASPASSSNSYRSNNPLPPTSHPPYFPAQTAAAPRRSPPRGPSPHAPGLPPPPSVPYQFPSSATLHPPLVLPSQQNRTPPPPQSQANGLPSRPGMSIQNILEQGSSASPQASDPGSVGSQTSRSATDNSMLNSLMPRGL